MLLPKISPSLLIIFAPELISTPCFSSVHIPSTGSLQSLSPSLLFLPCCTSLHPGSIIGAAPCEVLLLPLGTACWLQAQTALPLWIPNLPLVSSESWGKATFWSFQDSLSNSRLPLPRGFLHSLTSSVWRLFLRFSKGCFFHVVGSNAIFKMSPFLMPLLKIVTHPPIVCAPMLCFICFTASTAFQHPTYFISWGCGYHPTRGEICPTSHRAVATLQLSLVRSWCWLQICSMLLRNVFTSLHFFAFTWTFLQVTLRKERIHFHSSFQGHCHVYKLTRGVNH